MNWASGLGSAGTARRRLGVCRLLGISISVHFVRANHRAPHEIRDTILHEIAHALAWTRHGSAPTARGGNKSAGKGAVPCAAAKPDAIRVTTYTFCA